MKLAIFKVDYFLFKVGIEFHKRKYLSILKYFLFHDWHKKYFSAYEETNYVYAWSHL